MFPVLLRVRIALPSFSISAPLSRRSRGVLARRRTPFAGVLSIFPSRTVCSKTASRFDMVRAAMHLVARQLTDLSPELDSVGDRDSAFPLPHGWGDEFHN